MQRKFNKGDKVRLHEHIPPYILLDRGKKRTIVEVTYDHFHKCSWYLLGSNGIGPCDGECASGGFAGYLFRSYQLRPWNTTGVSGRPKQRQPYLKSSPGGKTP